MRNAPATKVCSKGIRAKHSKAKHLIELRRGLFGTDASVIASFHQPPPPPLRINLPIYSTAPLRRYACGLGLTGLGSLHWAGWEKAMQCTAPHRTASHHMPAPGCQERPCTRPISPREESIRGREKGRTDRSPGSGTRAMCISLRVCVCVPVVHAVRACGLDWGWGGGTNRALTVFAPKLLRQGGRGGWRWWVEALEPAEL